MNTDTYKTVLEEQLIKLKAELETIADFDETTGDWQAKQETTTESDPNDAADTAEDSIERQGEVSLLETRYRNVVRALQKIEAGTYGICEINGEQIEPERLAANPAARTNIANRERESELPL